MAPCSIVLTRLDRSRARNLSPIREISSSPRKMRPALGRWIPPSSVSNVDLPEPDGPRNATRSPGGIRRSTPRSATTSWPSNVR